MESIRGTSPRTPGSLHTYVCAHAQTHAPPPTKRSAPVGFLASTFFHLPIECVGVYVCYSAHVMWYWVPATLHM